MFQAVFTHFSPYLGMGRTRGWGVPHGTLVDNVVMQVFTFGSSKLEAFETCFSDTLIT